MKKPSITADSLSFLLLAGLLLATTKVELTAQEATGTAIETMPLAINLDAVNWGPPGGGNGFPVGVRTARQGSDPVTGGITYYALFPADSHFDLHWHTHDEFVVVVKGSVTIVLGQQSHSLSPGSYIVIPGKMKHSWDVPAGDDVVILVRRGGPADFHFVDQ
ncbi:MAG: cupin domain-containing protein [Proteobacteria bacterium]|nr:cupin domain-containing protein [Pseudomonadota bacterium]